MSKMRVTELMKFVKERHAIYLRRQAGAPKPWTKDHVLQTYRFTNMYRELDTVTAFIAETWREPNKNDPHLWLAMTVARFLNVSECLLSIGYPAPWDGDRKRQVIHHLKKRKEIGLQNFSGAYMVRSDPGCKIDYVVSVWDAMWQGRYEIERCINDDISLRELFNILVPYRGIGTFMAGQIIADLKYAPPLADARDWWTFAASGPGSRRGMNRLLGLPTNAPWKEEAWFLELGKLQKQIKPFCATKLTLPHAQDLQGWLCEWDKYERARLGEGRPRSLYDGEGEKP